MRAAIVFIASVATVLLTGASATTCPPGWTLFSDPAGLEGGQSCLYISTTTATHSQATKQCTSLGLALQTHAHLVTMSADAGYNNPDSLLRFVLDQSGCVDVPGTHYPTGTCPVYWTGAKKVRVGDRSQSSLVWKWSDAITPSANLAGACAPLTAADPPRPSGTCGVWGYYDDPKDDGSMTTNQAEDVDAVEDELTYPAFCLSGTTSSQLNDCHYGAIGYEYHGLFDTYSRQSLRYVCEIEVDSDGDKVPDFLDWCPGTPTGIPVDANGCTKLDMDADNDRYCGAMPSGAPMQFVPKPSKWCKKVLNPDGSRGAQLLDNCPSVNNPKQNAEACTPGSALGSPCNAACATGCQAKTHKKAGVVIVDIPVDSIRSCSTPSNAQGLLDPTQRCVAPYTPIATNKRYGCV